MAAIENPITSQSRPKRIVIATIGSLGDLHPCLALAQELKRRGHRVTIASTPYYRSKVEALGIAFHPMRPDWNPTDPTIIRQCEDLKKGPEVLYRKLILPHLRQTYEDLLASASTADLMMAGELVYAAPLVAEKLALPWVSVILSPFSFFSAQDPSVMVNAPSLIHLRKGGPSLYRFGLNLGRLAIRHWSHPVRSLRRDLGLTVHCDPVFRDKFSPDRVLALFSPLLAAQQADWPSQTLQPGFIQFDDKQQLTSHPLSAFLEAGTAPIVFTQGSTAVHNPGRFYETSAAAALHLGKRAVLLGMKTPLEIRSPDILTLPYAPYSQIFPNAAVNVHQGGSGTIGEAMRAGRPMLVVPYGWDQPDNAARIERLGVGLHLSRDRYTVTNAANALDKLLHETRYAERAVEVAHRIGGENALTAACDAIEAVLPA